MQRGEERGGGNGADRGCIDVVVDDITIGIEHGAPSSISSTNRKGWPRKATSGWKHSIFLLTTLLLYPIG